MSPLDPQTAYMNQQNKLFSCQSAQSFYGNTNKHFLERELADFDTKINSINENNREHRSYLWGAFGLFASIIITHIQVRNAPVGGSGYAQVASTPFGV